MTRRQLFKVWVYISYMVPYAFAAEPLVWQINLSSQNKFLWIADQFMETYPDINIIKSSKKNLENTTLVSCAPFSEKIQKLGKQGKLKDLSAEYWMSDFPAYTLTPFQSQSQGAIYCVPLALTTYGFLYHKDIFQQLALQEPRTLQQLIDILIRLQRTGMASPLIQTHAQRVIGPSVWQGEYGRTLWKKTSQDFDQKFKKSLHNFKNQLLVFQGDSHKPIESFLKKEHAILMARLDSVDTLDNSDIAAFKPPQIGEYDKCYMTQFAEYGVAIVKNSPQYSQGLLFLKWLASQDYAQRLMTQNQGLLPATQYALTASSEFTQSIQSWINVCEPSLPIVKAMAFQSIQDVNENNTKPLKMQEEQQHLQHQKQLPHAETLPIELEVMEAIVQESRQRKDNKSTLHIQDTHKSETSPDSNSIQDTHNSGTSPDSNSIQDTHNSETSPDSNSIQDTHNSGMSPDSNSIQDTHNSGMSPDSNSIQDTHNSGMSPDSNSIPDTHRSGQYPTPDIYRNIPDHNSGSNVKEIPSPELQPVPEQVPEADIPEHPEATLARE